LLTVKNLSKSGGVLGIPNMAGDLVGTPSSEEANVPANPCAPVATQIPPVNGGDQLSLFCHNAVESD
jgi:hypothetical protein